MAQLQVTANTSQAVGEHDKLTASVTKTQESFDKLEKSLNNTGSSSRKLNDDFKTIGNGFDALGSVIRTTYGWMERIAGGTSLIFNSLLKELDKIQGFNAIMSVTTGSTDKASESFTFLRRTADLLGIQFDALSNNYAKLVAAIPPGNEQLAIAERTFLGVSMAARTLHASNQDTQLMFYAVTQIASKGVVSMEELRRQLGEKMPGALQIAARAFGTTTDALEAAIRKGIVNSEKFLAGFSAELIRTFHDSAEIASTSVSAAINRLTNVWVDFVKQVLDSGAGNAIIRIFDALREKLSDPYIIGQFAVMVEQVSNKITGFIQNLTAEDLRNGFDAFTKAVAGITTVLGGMISALTWLMNNADKIAPAIAGLYGATKGAVLGTMIAGPGTGTIAGAGFGFLIGAGLGAEGAARLKPSQEDETKRFAMELSAKLKAMELRDQQSEILTQYRNLLKNYDLELSDVPSLSKPEFLTKSASDKFFAQLASDAYSSDAQRKAALQEFGKYGQLLPPRPDLKSILGGKGKGESVKRDELEGSLLESMGYNRNFLTEWANLDKLFDRHQLSLEELDKARDRLLDKQPLFVQYAKDEKEALDAQRKATMALFAAEDARWYARRDFVRDNDEYISQLVEEDRLLQASARDTFVSGGMKSFETRANDYLAQAAKLGDLDAAEKVVYEQRKRRLEILGSMYDKQVSAAAGLSLAVNDLQRHLDNHAQRAYETWSNLVQGLQGVWTNFIKTGRISFKSFIDSILTEMAKVTWEKYFAKPAGNLLASILAFGMKDGGVMTSRGPMDLRRYAEGGIASSPQVAVYGEGRRPEAIIPLPDGRTVPVTIKGGDARGQSVFNFYQTLNVGSNVSRAEVAQALAASNAQLKADILRSRNRAGAFA